MISGYVSLKRAGSNMLGLCPFHSEKTPSFTVFPGSGNFYCFGCGAGGDVISFIMKIENLDYRSALEFLAKRAGLTIPDDGKRPENGDERRRILEMNKAAAKFFHARLLESPAALGYLKKRQLPMSLINHFGLGFAPDNFGQLTDHLKKLGYREDEMVKAFLCGRSQKTGRPYDYFRNRVIIPIIDLTGEVIAFGGRVMDDSLPKYLNSSDTPVFKKSRNLFALNFAKNACAERMILCEGYMDVISLHGAGFTNAVATLGTAITPEQARLMKRYTQSVVISYDSDAAGQKAAEKAFRLLGEAGLEARILNTGSAKDPDEFIKTYGAAEFAKLLDKSKSRFEFRYDVIRKKYDTATVEGKVKAAAELTAVIASVYSRVEQDVYIRRVCEDLDLKYDGMRADVDRMIRKNTEAAKKEEHTQLIRATEGYGDRVNPDSIRNKRAANAEETLLGVLILYPELVAEYKKSPFFVPPEEFFTEFNRRVYTEVISEENGGFDIGSAGEKFTLDEIGRITKMTAMRQELTRNDMDVVRDSAEMIRSEHTKQLGIEDILNAKRARKTQQ